ncbi:hypothetical protein [Streptomyces sp. NBRC 109706]|uniref:hypothetical protein n=1 Tax=Streptomyces sp. NBRC 109706 TaxID=1550035 RepID=UPI0007818D7C|nr:hypothetical protein [Streptomyces sp. NBRC 109706]
MSESTERELWLIGQVVDHLGVASRTGARTFLRRAGLGAADYVTGASGRPEARYDAAAVRDAAARRPGQGHRTDLDERPATPDA